MAAKKGANQRENKLKIIFVPKAAAIENEGRA